MDVTYRCTHPSMTGAEGPIRALERPPILWVCDDCGTVEVHS